MDWKQHISTSPAICHGKPCIRGTRIMVSVVVDNIADGMSVEDIITNYPPLTADDVRAALHYAATLVREEEIVPLLEYAEA